MVRTTQTTSRIILSPSKRFQWRLPTLSLLICEPDGAQTHAEVRLLRFWEARNINKGGELISVDMLFIDENSTMVQGSIPALRQLQFKNRLVEGSIYTLTGFDVVRSNPKFRFSDSTFSIRFNEGTELEKLSTTVRTIPIEQFRF